jgi:hypothetical protein
MPKQRQVNAILNLLFNVAAAFERERKGFVSLIGNGTAA